MPCPLWLRINESVDGYSIFEPRWWGCICNSVGGGVMFATLSIDGDSIFEPRWWGCIYNFAFESVDGDSIYKPRWWGCIYNFVFRQRHGVQFLPPVCERFLRAVVNNSNKWDYRLTVRSIVKQRNWKQRRNREPSRELYTSCGKERSIKKYRAC